MERLRTASLAKVPVPALPTPGPGEISVGIVHLGVGAFHRAHQAVFTQRAMAAGGEHQWGICGASQRSATAAGTLLAQDCLYSVTERQGPTSRTGVVAAVRDALFARQQWEELRTYLASPSVSVVTTTVSEKGYRMRPSTGELLTEDEEVVSDATGGPPVTVVGQIARGLQARMQSGSGPLTILCCDNLAHNGATLQGLVLSFCRLLPGRQAGPLGDWVRSNVTFPNSVVDRIVPATSAEDLRQAAAALGVEDLAAVVTEPFNQWVIEDRFAGPRPPWDQAGATLVDDARPYEQMKLRLLNGSHSALAYLGGLAGYALMADAAQDPAFSTYTRSLMDLDVTPTLEVPSGFDVAAYKDALMGRFANSALGHRTAQVAIDGSQKLPYRLVSTVRDRLSAGERPRFALLAIAAWMRYVSAGKDDDGRALPLDDPMEDRLRAALAQAERPAQVVEALLSFADIFPAEVADDGQVRRLLAQDLEDLGRHGAAAVVAAAGR